MKSHWLLCDDGHTNHKKARAKNQVILCFIKMWLLPHQTVSA